MKKVIFSLALLFAAGSSFAQIKNVKEAKAIANEMKPDFAKAEQLIQEALVNPESKDDAETWNTALCGKRPFFQGYGRNAGSA